MRGLELGLGQGLEVEADLFGMVLLTEDAKEGTRAFLEKLPVNLDYREYPIAHQVSEESLRDVTNWLSERIKVSGN